MKVNIFQCSFKFKSTEMFSHLMKNVNITLSHLCFLYLRFVRSVTVLNLSLLLTLLMQYCNTSHYSR